MILGGLDPDGLWGHRIWPLDLPLQIPPRRSGSGRTTDQGDLRNAGPIRISPRPRPAAARGLGDQH